MPRIFISYRREDSKHAVGRLHAALKRHVRNPKRDIFIDIDNIPKGVDFVEYLDRQVAQCDVMLAVIGPSWLSAKDPNTNRRRLEDPADFVRIEVASALKRGIPVVPVVLDDTSIPSAAELPDELKLLARRNGERLEHESFDSDVERLIRNLPDSKSKSAPAPRATASASERRATGNGASWLGPVVALGLLAIGGGAYAWFGNLGDWRGLDAQPGSEVTAEAPPPSAPVEVATAEPAAAALDTASPAPAAPADDPAVRSAAVRRIQQSLKTLGQYSGAADGATGSATRSAAQAFATAQRTAPPDLAAAPIAEIEAFAARADQAALVWTTQEAAAWRVAKDADTRSPLDAYLRDFPNGPNAAPARSRIAALTAALPAPTPAAAAPAATTPTPDPLAEARARTVAAARDLSLRDDAAWSLARRTDTRAAYEAYLGDYRTGAHSVEANARLSSFAATAAEISAWSIAQSAGTKDGYAAYLRAYPDRPNANTARTKIEEFDRVSQADVEASAWSTAQRMDSVSAYEIYLKNHPQGPNVVQATSRISALTDPQRLVGRWDHHKFKFGEKAAEKLGTLPCLPGVEVKTASQAALQLRGRVFSGAEMFFKSYSTLSWHARQANGMVFTDGSGLTATWKFDDGSLVLSNGTQSCTYKK